MQKLISEPPSGSGLKAQSFSQRPEGAVEIVGADVERGPVERHLARESLAHELVADRHVGDEHLSLALLAPAAHLQHLAERQEFRVALHVRDEVEHLLGGMSESGASS